MGGTTVNKVKELRKLAASGVPIMALARMFGIAQSNASRIVSGERWAAVHDDPEVQARASA